MEIKHLELTILGYKWLEKHDVMLKVKPPVTLAIYPGLTRAVCAYTFDIHP